MATYRKIQEYVVRHSGFIPQTCWIAHVKELNGIPTRQAPNRPNKAKRVKPCPPAKRPAIEAALRHFRMI